LRRGATSSELMALIGGAWNGRDDRGAETRRAVGERRAFVPVENVLWRDPPPQMHTPGGGRGASQITSAVPSQVDPLWMRIHIDPAIAGEAKQGDPGFVGEIDRQRRGRRDRADESDAGDPCFLDDLERRSPTDYERVR